MPQEGVFRSLLADRRAAPDTAAGRVAFHRVFNGFHVESIMRTELAVLGSDRRPDHVAVNLVDAHPVARRAPAAEQVPEHRRGDRWRHETIGQDPEHRADDEDKNQLDDEGDESPGERPAAPALALVLRDRGLSPLRHRACLAAKVAKCQDLSLPQCSSAFTCG